jgi:hypothetical protein
MGCFKGSDPETQNQKRASRELEEKIRAWNKDYKKAIKLLLLGMKNYWKHSCIRIRYM